MEHDCSGVLLLRTLRHEVHVGQAKWCETKVSSASVRVALHKLKLAGVAGTAYTDSREYKTVA